MGIKSRLRVLSRLKELNEKEQFFPTWLSLIYNPTYYNRKSLAQFIKRNSKFINGEVLDFGCGSKPYQKLFDYREYVGVDIEENEGHNNPINKVDVFYDGRTLPFPNQHFDSIFCSEVIEHVPNINEILPELSRVIKSKGHLLITTPFIWPEHETPNDFTRYTSFGLKRLLEDNGFQVIVFDKKVSFPLVISQLTNLYLYNHVFTFKAKLIKYPLSILYILPINLIGAILNFLLPSSKTAYINNAIIARKK